MVFTRRHDSDVCIGLSRDSSVRRSQLLENCTEILTNPAQSRSDTINIVFV